MGLFAVFCGYLLVNIMNLFESINKLIRKPSIDINSPGIANEKRVEINTSSLFSIN
jgi:hypothetical protein